MQMVPPVVDSTVTVPLASILAAAGVGDVLMFVCVFVVVLV